MASGERGTPGRVARLVWSLAQVGLGPVGVALALLTLPLALLTVVGIGGPLLLPVVGAARLLTGVHRWWAGRLLAVPVPPPYRETAGRPRARARAALRDPATWRDDAWLVLNGTVGLVLTALPLAFLAAGLLELALAAVWPQIPDDGRVDGPPWLLVQVSDWLVLSPRVTGLSAGLLLVLLWWLLMPPVLRGTARVARSLLAPTASTLLAQRVDELAASRAETVDGSAAELRRIERDLHDGAQARLVALGMSLGLAEELLESDPQGARTLLAEARSTGESALQELRDLVRGIHPPVLADRGLAGAVSALALATPLPVDVEPDLPARLPAAVESAVYFAVTELLTNVAKHADATGATVRLAHTGQVLTVLVTDDGRGGAHVDAAGGLRGVQRRLAAFDGVIAVHSPSGGPTTIRLEVPCASSSPKTTPS